MTGSTAIAEDEVRRQLLLTQTLFQDIRQRFNGASVERGGNERPGLTPVYTRKFKTDAAAIFHADRYTIEASFSPEQLNLINETLSQLKAVIAGKAGAAPLADRIIYHFAQTTGLNFVVALIKSTEDVLDEFMTLNPEQAYVSDAIFRVAGGEGFRDLVSLYGARLLEQAIKQSPADPPDLLRFVDIHDKVMVGEGGQTLQVKYEVWCPGHSLALEYFTQYASAATRLVNEHGVQFSRPIKEEMSEFPRELSTYWKGHVQGLVNGVLQRYGIA